MPLLLLLPLLILAIVAIWALLLPISLIQRFRFGRKRRRVQGWVVSSNAWLVLVSVAAFFIGGFVGIGLMIVRRATRKTAIPFGPFMVVGAWIGIFAGECIARSYTGLLVG